MASGEPLPASALVTAIQHFCLHDGPGIRSVVFFKGCPLRCAWCQNPETWRAAPEHLFKARLCIGCERCVAACAGGHASEPGRRGEGCTACFRCAEACPSGALTVAGKGLAVEEVVEAIRPELPFLRSSGGGVTLSGGEPTFAAPRFAAELARRLARDGAHVALETCGHARLRGEGDRDRAAAELVAAVDLLLFDLKLVDPREHLARCGTRSDAVLESLAILAGRAARREGPRLWPRIPLVPGVTDGPDNLRGWARILLGHGLPFVTLIPYHDLGAPKRAWLGLPPAPEVPPLRDEAREAAHALLEAEGLACFEPGEEEWSLLG